MSYSVCTDTEFFTGDYETPELAAYAGFLAAPELDAVEVAKNVMYSADHYISAHNILDDMKNSACDVAGEFADDWLEDVTEEQLAELESMVAAWANNIEKPNFWEVTEVKTITRAELIATGHLQKVQS